LITAITHSLFDALFSFEGMGRKAPNYFAPLSIGRIAIEGATASSRIRNSILDILTSLGKGINN
jgi:hypothetical protein